MIVKYNNFQLSGQNFQEYWILVAKKGVRATFMNHVWTCPQYIITTCNVFGSKMKYLNIGEFHGSQDFIPRDCCFVSPELIMLLSYASLLWKHETLHVAKRTTIFFVSSALTCKNTDKLMSIIIVLAVMKLKLIVLWSVIIVDPDQCWDHKTSVDPDQSCYHDISVDPFTSNPSEMFPISTSLQYDQRRAREVREFQ